MLPPLNDSYTVLRMSPMKIARLLGDSTSLEYQFQIGVDLRSWTISVGDTYDPYVVHYSRCDQLDLDTNCSLPLYSGILKEIWEILQVQVIYFCNAEQSLSLPRRYETICATYHNEVNINTRHGIFILLFGEKSNMKMSSR